MSDLMLDVDQAGELKAAFRRGNWTNAEIKRLSEGNALTEVRDVILGRAEIKAVEHLIDCDADPYIPEGWKVEEHRKGGMVKFNPTRIEFFLSKQQRKGKVIVGNELRKELADKPVLNANVLDWLLKHPHLIPEEWKRDENGNTRYIFFWGTIYRDPDGDLGVRDLYWRDDRWCWGCSWLGSGWVGGYPAAVLAS